MVKMMYIIAEIINNMHDWIVSLVHELLPSLTDKDLHFWIIGVFGIVFYWMVNSIFKRLAKISIEVVSFTYTMTVLIIVVIAIEIQQKMTNRGSMEFEDIVAGLLGFIVMFGVYLLIQLVVFFVREKFMRRQGSKEID